MTCITSFDWKKGMFPLVRIASCWITRSSFEERIFGKEVVVRELRNLGVEEGFNPRRESHLFIRSGFILCCLVVGCLDLILILILILNDCLICNRYLSTATIYNDSKY